MQKIIFAVVFFAFFFLSDTAISQFYNGSQMTFGKNRIQHREFLWTYFKFDDFDTYFYLNGRELAVTAAKYTTIVLPGIEKKLETGLNDKIQFIIFNNLSDLKQSNIGLISEQRYNTGGITHIIGNKVFLYFNGSHQDFEKQIRSGIANVLFNQIMLGSSVGAQIKNSMLYALPKWYPNGLLSYMGEDWSTDIDNRVKDGILSGRYENFNQLEGEEALYAGHSFWRFVAQKYGKHTIGPIVNMTQISHSVENGFLYVIGISFNNLIEEWLNYYRGIYQIDEEAKDVAGQYIQKRIKKHNVYSRLKISPDGRNVAYTTNESGKYKLYIQDVHTKKRKKIFRGGFRLDEKIDYTYPIMAWHPNGQLLSFIVERKGEVYLYFYTLSEKKKQKVILYNFEKILNYSYSPDGRYFVFSAVQKGQSDLYIYNIASGSHNQLTKDIYDDLDPVFVNGTKGIVFASNRPSDTLEWDPDEVPFEVPFGTDLFLYNNAQKSVYMKRVTNTPFANEKQPVKNEKGHISYLSDENGIYNQFIGRFDSTISQVDTAVHYRYFTESLPVTNYSRGILFHDVAPEAGLNAKVIFENGQYKLLLEELLPPENQEPVQLTNTAYKNAYNQQMAQRVLEMEIEKKRALKKYTKRFRNVFKSAKKKDAVISPGQINTDDYEFNKQAFISMGDDEDDGVVAMVDPLKKEDTFKIPKRLNYRTEYSINETTTQLDFTSLNYFYQPFGTGAPGDFYNLGLNGFFKVGMTDLLEDHRIVGGFRIPINLRNIEYLFSYANMKKRLDKEFVFVRQASEQQYTFGYFTRIIRYRSYQAYYILSYPLSPVLAIKGTVNVRYEKGTWLSTNDYDLRQPDIDNYWGGLKGEVVYDDTKELGLNLYVGTRFKVFAEYTQIIGDESKNMTVLGFDIRNYQRIHKVFIWANRFAASTSFGKNRLIYYMGGVDNWLIPRFNNETPIDPRMNYAYQTLSTNMRGFDQNARNGNNFFVLNSELRFPIFRYFYKRPLKSKFIKNFQLVGFGDIGMAWAGSDPYSENNSLYTKVIQDGSLHIVIREQKEPLIGGFGFGARTMIFGYFLRADLAWGIEDRKVKKPIFYLSLSLDF